MKPPKGTRRTCPNGHSFLKSSDCPTCPLCEQARAPRDGFLATLSAPARRALETAALTTLRKLSSQSEADILRLHGMGPASLPKLRAALKAAGLHFAKNRRPKQIGPLSRKAGEG